MAQIRTTITLKDIIKKFLVSVCRFTADAAKEITKNQGYDELDEFYLLNDKGVNTLCSIVRKPHASVSGSTSGHAASNLAKECLKLVIFAMKHFKRVSCKIDLDSLTKKDIITFSQQHQMELTFKNKTKGFSQATFKYLTKTFEMVMEQLEHACGVAGVMLAYVPHKNLILLDEDKDPLTNYPSLDAKAIACTPILEEHVALPGQSAKAIALLEENRPFCNTFCINMVTVWNILFEIIGQTPACLHAAPTKKEKNGRKLYRLMFAHYLGSDHVNHLANKMEARLASLTYCGKQKNWDWSRYTNVHIEQHTIANNLMEHSYSGLDKHSKVRHLLTGIQDNAVQPMVCQVLAMREDNKTFTKCLVLFANFIRHLKQNPSNMRHVAELGSAGQGGGRGRDAGGRGGGGHGRGGRGGRGSPSAGGPPDQAEVDKVTWLQANKYYSTKEYAKFTVAEKVWIHQHRTTSPATKRKVAAMSRDNDNAARELDDDGELFKDDNDVNVLSRCSTRSNSTNPALVRQEKKTTRRM
jgi:hypothetical protein